MAASSNSLGRLTMSEPRSRARAYRVSDSADDHNNSTGAAGGLSLQEDRLNNWDFTDWRPSSTFDQKKKIKKGNEEKGQEKRGCLLGSTSPAEGGRVHTPSTFPRTKGLPKREREQMENLRATLTFSDGEEPEPVQLLASGSERNNERYVPRRPADVPERRRNEVGARPKQPTRAHNRNVLRLETNQEQAEKEVEEDATRPDSNQIVGRLMQIRDYIKQATSMLERIRSSTDPGDNRRAAQLEQVVERLREQENKYLDLLLSLSTSREESLMARNMSKSREEEDEEEQEETAEPVRPSGETESEAATELDMESQTSDDVNVCDLSKKNEELEALREQHELLQKMLHQQEQLRALQGRQTALMAMQREAEQRLSQDDAAAAAAAAAAGAGGDSQSDNNDQGQGAAVQGDVVPPELQELRQRLSFLKGIYQNSMATLEAVRGNDDEQDEQNDDEEDEDEENEDEDEEEDEEQEEQEEDEDNEMEDEEEEEGAVGGIEIPPQLKDLHSKLDYLKNLYDMKDSLGSETGVNQSEEDCPQSNGRRGELSLLQSMEQTHLEDKLVDLQTKKQQMDQLLDELQTLRNDKYQIQKNQRRTLVDPDAASSTTSSQVHLMAGIQATASANSTANDAQQLLGMIQAQDKMQKLGEVKERLNDLRGLVQYYQSGNDLIHGDDEAAAAGQPQNQAREKNRKEGLNEIMSQFRNMEQEMAQLSRDGLVAADSASDAASRSPTLLPTRGARVASIIELASSHASEDEETAQWRAVVGAAQQMEEMDDAELTEKVHRLQSAKEKLRRLQELVRMIQTNPDMDTEDGHQQLLLAAASLQQPEHQMSLFQQRGAQQQQQQASNPRRVARHQQQQQQSALSEDNISMSSNPDPPPPPATSSSSAQRAAENMTEREQEAYYEQKVLQQRAELENLMEERHKLLHMQEELQRLHESIPPELNGRGEGGQEQGAAAAASASRESNKNPTPAAPAAAAARQPEPVAQARAAARNLPPPPRGLPPPLPIHPPTAQAAAANSDAAALLNMQEELQRTGTGSVTFQEPLETVITNDELYGRMRQQRILREELRQKTKELQDMMRKDRPRKHYSRNQDIQRGGDNHSDNISFSTKSELFGGSVSVDQTMATWGGSTVDNMDGIEEDDNNNRRDAARRAEVREAQQQRQQRLQQELQQQQQEHQRLQQELQQQQQQEQQQMQQQQQQQQNNQEDEEEAEEDQEVDDGYPSDGIVQVEEEEEAADEGSDDHDTYTIEEEPYIPRGRSHRRAPSSPGDSSGQAEASAARRSGGSSSKRNHRRQQGAPLVGRSGGRDYRYNFWPPDNNEVLNNVRPSPPVPPRPSPTEQSSNQRSRRYRNQQQQQQQQSPSSDHGLRRQVQAISRQVTELTNLCNGMAQQQQQQMQQEQHTGNDFLSSQSSTLQSQMLLSLNQCYSQLLHQQQDMSERFARLERTVLVNNSPVTINAPSMATQTDTLGGLAPSSQYSSPNTYVNHRGGSASDHFHIQPVFPENFPYSCVSSYGSTFAPPAPAPTPPTYNNSNYSSMSNNNQQQYRRPYNAATYTSSPDRIQNTRGSRGVYYDEDTDIPIETIQASDRRNNDQAAAAAAVGAVPRLNLMEEQPPRNERLKKRYNTERNYDRNNQTASRIPDVIGERFPLNRAAAAAQLANQRVYQGGVSAGISGAMQDTASSVSSIPPQQSPLDKNSGQPQRLGNVMAGGEFSQFERLRETIYSEVATLISQNERRPHYLIELFRELQLLSSDYLRQRALYAVQELVACNLPPTENAAANGEFRRQQEEQQQQRQQEVVVQRRTQQAANITQQTQTKASTSSKKAATQAQLYARNPRRQQESSPATFDYVETCDTTSSMSTPDNSDSRGHVESPFAQDSLGDTVIHLDKNEYDPYWVGYMQNPQALQRMREYERHLHELPNSSGGATAAGASAGAVGGAGSSSDIQQSPSSAMRGSTRPLSHSRATQQAPPSADSSSAQDNTDSDDNPSVSEVLQYPRIDPAQLDSQIKAVMTEIIPVLQEHMDDVCSQQLLRYINRLVLALSKDAGTQGSNKQEFVRFFHKQLASILQDTLAKFEGRKLRECGEDMLVDLSEILFNELAFFRLMQDLDDPKAKDSQTSTETAPTQDELENMDDEDNDEDNAEDNNDEDNEDNNDDDDASSEEEDEENEESEINSEAVEDDDIVQEKHETEGLDRGEKSRKRNHADMEKEEEEEDDEIEFEGDEEELGKDRDDELAARVDIVEEEEDERRSSRMKIMLAPSETKPYTRIGSDEDDEGEDDESLSAEDIAETAVARDAEKEKQDDKEQEEEDDDDDDEDDDEIRQPQPEPIQINGGGVGEGLMNGEATQEITIDDLPSKLTGLTQDELANKISEEAANNNLDGEAILEAVASAQCELAGSGDAIKEPADSSTGPGRQL